jgi:hypothetical protein
MNPVIIVALEKAAEHVRLSVEAAHRGEFAESFRQETEAHRAMGWVRAANFARRES